MIDYKNMKSPLCYQLSEYDCGQATILNAINFLFRRGEIQPVIIKHVEQQTLDMLGQDGQIGKSGTSNYAMEYLCNWINLNSNRINMDLGAKLLKEVDINNKELNECINNGGVAIFRVWQDCEHYVLCTALDEEYVYMFDPYYLDENEYDNDTECRIVSDKPFNYNRIVSKRRLNENSKEDFALVKNGESKILLLFRKDERK